MYKFSIGWNGAAMKNILGLDISLCVDNIQLQELEYTEYVWHCWKSDKIIFLIELWLKGGNCMFTFCMAELNCRLDNGHVG